MQTEPEMTQERPSVGRNPAISREEFARRLQLALVEKGWNQSELARAVNTGRHNISVYASAKSYPMPPLLKNMATALGVDPEWLLPGMLPSPDHPSASEEPAESLKLEPGADKNLAHLKVDMEVSWADALKVMEILYGQRKTS
jgi:transcriptional regulator with XRE-family HTH domain